MGVGGVGGVLMTTGEGNLSKGQEGQETRASREEKGNPKGERRINEKGKGRGRKP